MSNLTKTEITQGRIGFTEGWIFSAYFGNRKYPNLISALYKSKEEAQAQLKRYIATGKFDFYGSAEI